MEGPRIKLPLSSLQTNAFVVASGNKKKSQELQNKEKKKAKISTNILHDRFHKSDGAIATIKAHNLWEDVNITQGNDSVCTSCKIMTIPSHSRGKESNSVARHPLDEIQVDTVPNPEPLTYGLY